MLASQLRKTGYEVVESASRQEGIELLRRMEFRAGLVELSGREAASAVPGGQGRPFELKKTPEFVQITGSSESIQSLRRLLARLAPTGLALLVSGEHGTGKKHVARAIHQASACRNLSLVTLDSSTFSESALEGILFGFPAGAGLQGKPGLLGLPEVGTVFLGSIDSLSVPLQRRLLEAIEEGTYQAPGDAKAHTVTARVVCGSSRPLSQAVDQGRVLYDLYSRLSLYELRIPPLRERVEDIPALLRSLLERLCRSSGRLMPAVERDAQRALTDSPWPGNVRELGNVLERTLSLLTGPVIRLSDLPTGPYRTIRKEGNLKEAR
jgi:DNA-binding NtrC family response regulator